MSLDSPPSIDAAKIPALSITLDCTKYRKCRSSGRNWGQRWLLSEGPSLVTGCGVPPEAEMRMTGLVVFGVNRIVPSCAQVPPRPSADSQIGSGGPPEMSIRFNFPLAKNATDWLSGDQKAKVAPSVLSSGRAVAAFRGRSHNI